MKRFFVSLLIILPLLLQAQEVTLRVSVKAAMLPEGGKVYISGSTQSTGGWNPSAVELEPIGALHWVRDIRFNAGETVEFKITGGSWAREAIYEQGNVPQNFALRMTKDTTLEIFVPFWKSDADMPRTNYGSVVGKVITHKNMEYPKLLPRDVHVWLPPGYDEEEERYPVLYMHDGQNVFDPATSTMGFDWRADDIADSLIRAGEMRKIIIVAINNTRNRYPEYTRGDTTDAYMEFCSRVLKKFIDENYRTLPDRENTAVAGSSGGGLISFRLAWEYDDVYSMVAALSPAFKIYNIDYVQPVYTDPDPPRNLQIYLDNGGLGLEERLQPGIDEMLLALKNQGYEEGDTFVWKKFPDALHNEKAWAERFHLPLLQFFGTKK